MNESVVAVDEAWAAVGEAPKDFEDYFIETYEPVLRALFLVTGSIHEAEDVAQEAFVKIYERWEDLRHRPNPGGYAYRTALNVYRSRLRRMRVAARRLVRPDIPDPLAASEDRDELRRALERLPRGQREALVLVEWLGMRDEEVAEVLGVAAVTVRVRISRGRHALKEMGREESDE